MSIVETMPAEMISSAMEIAGGNGRQRIEKGLERMNAHLIMKSIGYCLQKRTKTSTDEIMQQLKKKYLICSHQKGRVIGMR